MSNGFSGWNGSVTEVRAMQATLAEGVVVKDGFAKPLKTVAGFEVRFEQEGAVTRAAAVLLDAVTLQPIVAHVVRVPTAIPYIPGLLSFRVLQALLAVLEQLPQQPDLVFVAGHGIAHPRRLGIAAHFGVATGLPSIGVAKKILVGDGIIPHPTRGAYTALRDGREQIGWLLRSKVKCNPLVVSPGHRVAMASAADLVMRYVTTHRLPEPMRLAERLDLRPDERQLDEH
jgi:deoxyribonuclease V